ncbi:hypothetical protein KOW79_021965 [Hemibagrus wyckioides]|uniref:Uncharacterized protein n=1 Tax=Hemibagrus wyckioides TaxID=337641 RepID=A0A9D3S8K1_9TELE|nr:hypothetical protein KOW79_021965 [Hemibagrus wyckioides]
MSKSLYILLILLEAVLHGTDSTVSPAASENPSVSPKPTSVTDLPETSPEPSTDFTVESTSADLSTKAPETSTPDGGSSGNIQNGLTPGEAAGVAVGTIAGVAALGGGIYAGLKYTGKLG